MFNASMLCSIIDAMLESQAAAQARLGLNREVMTQQPCLAAICQPAPLGGDSPQCPLMTGTKEAEQQEGLRFWKSTLLGLDPPFLFPWLVL